MPGVTVRVTCGATGQIDFFTHAQVRCNPDPGDVLERNGNEPATFYFCNCGFGHHISCCKRLGDIESG